MRKIGIVAVLFLLCFITLNKTFAVSIEQGNVSWSPESYTNTISWSDADPLFSTSVVYYHVFRQFGQATPEYQKYTINGADNIYPGYYVNPSTKNGSIYLGYTDETTFTDQVSPMCDTNFGADYRYLVVALDTGTAEWPRNLAKDQSNIRITTEYYFTADELDFIHNMKRADAAGSQDGFGQKWTFTYKLKWDAYINMEIYSPNGTFTYSSSDVDTVYDGERSNTSPQALIKTIVDYTNLTSAARSFQMADNSYTNEEVWDCRDSSGNVVPNGVYYVLFKAYTHNPYTGTPRFVGQWFGCIPVDILRITKITTQGISGSGGTASIGYTINGDANVYILICSSGTAFTRATSEGDLTFLGSNTYHYYTGFPLPLNDAKTAVDASKLKKVLVFYRKYGTYTETWNGLDQNGGTLANGIYAVSFAGRDGYGNNALNAQGNDGPIETTITIDKTAAETAQDSTAPTISKWYVNSSEISAGQTIDQPITSVAVDIADETGGSGVNISACTISLTLTGATTTSVSGTTTNDGTDTLTFTPTQTVNTNGTYTISITAIDTTGNSKNYTRSFSVSITAAGTVTSFENSVKAYPNPAKRVNLATIAYNITAASTLSLEIYNILGELVYTDEWEDTSAGSKTRTWNLVNGSKNVGAKVGSGVYIYKITAKDGTSTYSVTKKLIVIQ
ncbi:MAG: T9SS type A sorting domain-containing protein [Elusimicrobiota bacterium]